MCSAQQPRITCDILLTFDGRSKVFEALLFFWDFKIDKSHNSEHCFDI